MYVEVPEMCCVMRLIVGVGGEGLPGDVPTNLTGWYMYHGCSTSDLVTEISINHKETVKLPPVRSSIYRSSVLSMRSAAQTPSYQQTQLEFANLSTAIAEV